MTTTPPVGSTFFGMDVSGLGDQLSSLRRQLSKRVLLLEFGNNFLRLSEASITPNGLQLNHISGLQLPPEALERGVPAEPIKMAGLIGEICKEKKIRAHRVAVVLPPEVAFQRLVELPADLPIDEARQYIQDSKNSVQIPFPLDQTDFDLAPVLSSVIGQQHGEKKPYMLSAIPQQLVDRVIEMLKLADFELQLLELGSLSQLRVLASDLMALPHHQVDLVLELLPDSSNLLMVTSSGLLASERLSAIRDFPEPNLDQDQVTTALEAGLSAESFVIQDDRYLPISDLDLRVLLSDFKKALARFDELCPGVEIRRLQLTGINSAHPLLAELLQDGLGLPVEAYRPMLANGLSGYFLDDVLVQAGLGRLVGLGLGLLPREQLVDASLDSANNDPVASDQVAGVHLDQLIEAKVNRISAPMLPSVLPESVPDVDKPESHQQVSLIDSQEMLEAVEVMEVVDITPANNLPAQVSEDEDEWPRIVEDELKEDALKEDEVSGELSEEEWPRIGGDELKENALKEDEVSGELSEEEWPRIGGEELKEDALKEDEVSGELSEEEWPRIGGEELKENALKEDEVSGELSEEEWPRIGGEELKENALKEDEVSGELSEEEWPRIVEEELKENALKEDEVSGELSEEEWPRIVEEELKENALKEDEVSGELRDEEREIEILFGSAYEQSIDALIAEEKVVLDQQASTEQLDDPLLESPVPPVLPKDVSLSIPGFKNDMQTQHSSQKKKASKNESIEPAQGADSLGELRFADSDE